MTNQFISPNWHVVLIHYPIALLSTGIIIELLTWMWPRGLFRAAGRWMILLGALLALPALTAGMYAYRQVILHGSAQPSLLPWHDVIARTSWTRDQRDFMCWHIWLNSIGVGVAVLAVTGWIAASDTWRRKLYLPALIALICSIGLLGTGAWFGGESIYRYGTAVGLPEAPSQAAHVEPVTDAGEAHHHAAGRQMTGIKWFLPPLELHIVLAGLAVAIGVGALGLTLRRLEPVEAAPEPAETIALGEEPADVAAAQAAVTPGAAPTGVHVYEARPFFAGRFWMFAAQATLSTAVAGAWSVVGALTRDHIQRNISELGESHHRRLLLHVIFGVTLLVLTLVLAGIARFARRQRGVSIVFLAVTVLVIAIQLWLGLAMLYDGHDGPLWRFSPTTTGS